LVKYLWEVLFFGVRAFCVVVIVAICLQDHDLAVLLLVGGTEAGRAVADLA
jgi:hypothetical protein